MSYRAFDLDGKVALITGGNSGIGLGMADALAAAGAGVSIWGTNPDKNAAAATGTGMLASSTPIIRMPETFHADHPFLYLIRDRVTGCILFMGRLTDPRG